ncbi:Retrovirus-related Pol polyprotein, partial [Mucuna pruriens]
MDLAQLNYTTTKKELLAIVFALDKFCSYLLGSKIIVFSDHDTLKFLLKKPNAKLELIQWMLLLHEFNIKIKDKKGAKNSIADHLSRIERESDPMPIRDEFPNKQLLQINTIIPWFADIFNFVVASQFPLEASQLHKERLKSDAKCILDTEINLVLQFCHGASGGDHYGSTWTARKVLDCEFYWPTIFRDAYQFVFTCEKCQK